MTKREEAAQLYAELTEMAAGNATATAMLDEAKQEYFTLFKEGEESYNVDQAFLHYQTAVINYVQQVDLCLLKQLSRERLAYDLFMCVADDSSISPNEKIIKRNIATELIEMIPKVGEYIEVASDIGSEMIDAAIKTSEVNVRYAAIRNSIAMIDIEPSASNSKFSTAVDDYVKFLLDKTILIDKANSSNEEEVCKYYVGLSIMINNYIVRLRDKSNEIQAYIPKSKKQYPAEMSGLLRKTSVATMFKSYLLDWLNNSGHYIHIYSNFTQSGMDYRIDYNSPKKSYIYEPSMLFKTEDIAVTNALVSLGLLSRANAPVTESKIRSFGLKVAVEQILDVQYRTN